MKSWTWPLLRLAALALASILLSRRLSQRTSSYVFALLRYAYALWTQVEQQSRERNRVYEDSNPSIREDTYQRLLARKLWIFKKEEPQFLPHVPKILEYLNKMRRSCEAKDIGFLVVILPEELQVDEEVRATIFAAKPRLRPEDFDFDLPNRMLHKEFERLGIEYLDLLPAMREVAKTRKIYKPRNTHWNLLGNRLAAQEIYPRLKEELMPYWGVDQ